MKYMNDEIIAKTESYADRLNKMECALGRYVLDHPETINTEVDKIRIKLWKAQNEVYVKVTEKDFAFWEELINEADELINMINKQKNVIIRNPEF